MRYILVAWLLCLAGCQGSDPERVFIAEIDGAKYTIRSYDLYTWGTRVTTIDGEEIHVQGVKVIIRPRERKQYLRNPG